MRGVLAGVLIFSLSKGHYFLDAFVKVPGFSERCRQTDTSLGLTLSVTADFTRTGTEHREH